MKMLIANAGSSSFKCQLFDMPSEKVLAKLRIERLKTEKSAVDWTDVSGNTKRIEIPLLSYGAAVQFVIDRMTDPDGGPLSSIEELEAVAFKTVYAKGMTGCLYLDQKVLDAMAEYNRIIAPIHNPAYIETIESFKKALPNIPMIGLFENFFYRDFPDYVSVLPIPWEWTEKYDIKKHCFHGSSHYYCMHRAAELMGKKTTDLNMISCHLGGGSSIQCIERGTAIDGTGGFSLPQSGIPQATMAGNADALLIPYLYVHGEGDIDELSLKLGLESGISGISGMGFDMRDLQKAAEEGHDRARLATDNYVHSLRKALGGWLAVLGHVDVITMEGGTGEASPYIRKRVLERLEEFGIVLDDRLNEEFVCKEGRISADSSRTEIWVIRTNEEIVVARKSFELLTAEKILE